MISNKILTKTCDIKALSTYTYDTMGCPISAIYATTLSAIPCYYTEMAYETLPGKEPIKDTYRMFLNSTNVSSLNTNCKVFVDNKTFDILNVSDTFGLCHFELIIKRIDI